MIKHIHKYRRVYLDKAKQTPVYRCMLPDCSHYIAAILVIGKSSICWKCNGPFVITPAVLQRSEATPCCGCARKRKPVDCITPAFNQVDEQPIDAKTIDDLMKEIADG